jgi:hypothetical protein
LTALAGLGFLTPSGALIALAALIPLAAIGGSELRHRRIRWRLGARSQPLRARLPAAVGVVAAIGLLAAAAAQPVVHVSKPAITRIDAEIYMVFDNSRSMLARESPAVPSRFERAQQIAVTLRRSLPGVQVGVVSLTDRPVVHLFPTSDARVFEDTVMTAIEVQRPPASKPTETATDLSTLALLARDNYFRPSSTKRLAVILTDGESVPFDPAVIDEHLAEASVRFLGLRLWSPSERIWDAAGRLEPYRPEAEATAALGRLPRLVGGEVFSENDGPAALAAMQELIGESATVLRGTEEDATRPLGPLVALAAAFPLAFLIARRR